MSKRTYMGIPRERIPWAPRVDKDLCAGCGECMDVCPNGVFRLDEEKGIIEVAEPLNCVVLCDKCAGFCPVEALSFPDKEETKSLLKKILSEQDKKE
jgi:ferredoxin